MADRSTLLRVALVGLLVVLGPIACTDDDTTARPGPDSTSSDVDEDRPASPTSEASSAAPAPVWVELSSVEGLLNGPVVWEGGLAAIHRDETAPRTGARVWLSTDGDEWAPAPNLPDTEIGELAAHGGALFVTIGGLDDPTASRALWHSVDGQEWTEVLVGPDIEHAAIGPQRSVVWAQGPPFEIAGVFDTTTLEPVTFEPIPEPVDLDPTDEVAELAEERGTLVYQGSIAALDDGFLAIVGWFESIDPERVVTRAYHSVDGTTWTEHPDPEAHDLTLPIGGQVPAVDGMNLIGPATTAAGAYLTDTGLELVPAPVPPPIGEIFSGLSSTGDAFVAEAQGTIHYSHDGLDWSTLPAPADWSSGADIDDGEPDFLGASVVRLDNDLVAVAGYGMPVAWDFPEDTTTRIWKAPAATDG